MLRSSFYSFRVFRGEGVACWKTGLGYARHERFQRVANLRRAEYSTGPPSSSPCQFDSRFGSPPSRPRPVRRVAIEAALGPDRCGSRPEARSGGPRRLMLDSMRSCDHRQRITTDKVTHLSSTYKVLRLNMLAFGVGARRLDICRNARFRGISRCESERICRRRV